MTSTAKLQRGTQDWFEYIQLLSTEQFNKIRAGLHLKMAPCSLYSAQLLNSIHGSWSNVVHYAIGCHFGCIPRKHNRLTQGQGEGFCSKEMSAVRTQSPNSGHLLPIRECNLVINKTNLQFISLYNTVYVYTYCVGCCSYYFNIQ